VIDYDELFLRLLTRDAPSAGMVAPENIAGEVDQLPAVIFDSVMAGQVSNGPGLWSGTLTVTVTGAPAEAWAVFSALYDAVRTWAPYGGGTGRIDGVGAIERVDDVSFERPPGGGSPPAGGKGSQQYTGTWSVLLRTINMEGVPHAGT
jgi:hypothetical protein